MLVVACALWHFQLLITLFFFWASVHVLHQIAYILECYDRRQTARLQKWSRFIDYAVVFGSLYPLASYRFIHDEFAIGSTLLLYPEMLKTPLVFYAVSAFFVLALAAFVAKTVIEVRQRRVHYPKILLMAVTIGLSILITSYSGDRLEIAFQGFNTWHSFQYLALTWYITTLRQQRGEIAQALDQARLDLAPGFPSAVEALQALGHVRDRFVDTGPDVTHGGVFGADEFFLDFLANTGLFRVAELDAKVCGRRQRRDRHLVVEFLGDLVVERIIGGAIELAECEAGFFDSIAV